MKILIINDHALICEGLNYILNKLDKSVDIFEASHYEEGMRLISENPDLDLALLDLNMSGRDGFAVLDTIGKNYPTLLVVTLSASDYHSDIKRALDAGAKGYIPKSATSPIILNALRLIFSGGVYVPPSVTENRVSLTPRQLEVLDLLIEGCPNKLIAYRLEVAEATVKMHVTSILKGLGVSNRTQAAMSAKNLGYE